MGSVAGLNQLLRPAMTSPRRASMTTEVQSLQRMVSCSGSAWCVLLVVRWCDLIALRTALQMIVRRLVLAGFSPDRMTLGALAGMSGHQIYELCESSEDGASTPLTTPPHSTGNTATLHWQHRHTPLATPPHCTDNTATLHWQHRHTPLASLTRVRGSCGTEFERAQNADTDDGTPPGSPPRPTDDRAPAGKPSAPSVLLDKEQNDEFGLTDEGEAWSSDEATLTEVALTVEANLVDTSSKNQQPTHQPHATTNQFSPHRNSVDAPHKHSVDAPHKHSVDAPHKHSVDAPHKHSVDAPHKHSVDAPHKHSLDAPHRKRLREPSISICG